MDTPEKITNRVYSCGGKPLAPFELRELIEAYGAQCRRAGAEAMSYAAMEAAACTGAPIDTDAAIRRAFHALPLAAEAASPGDRIEKLQAFKDYVHKRLDDAGIPTHPNGAHSQEGCRVGDRLDIILAAEALSMLPRAIPSGPEPASPAAGWAADIVRDEWQMAIAEFALRPGSYTETVIARILNRLDDLSPTAGWRPIEPPFGVWLRTKREGEAGENISMFVGEGEWHTQDGRSTVTHSTFLPPTHWMPIDAPSEEARAG